MKMRYVVKYTFKNQHYYALTSIFYSADIQKLLTKASQSE